MSEEALRKAILKAGNQTKLSEMMNESQQSISHWLNKGKVPAEQVLTIEKLTGVPRYELRPDIYPPEEYKKAS